MSWKVEVVEMVRVLIGDTSDDSPTYCDARLEKAVVISAHQMTIEMDFPVTYIVNIVRRSITPDPTESPRDETFIYLLALKTACMVISSELRKYAASSIGITDGPSSVQMGEVFKNMKILAEDLCTRYDVAMIRYQNGQAGEAVMTPFTMDQIHGDRFI